MNKRITNILLIAIILTGAFLRFYQLGAESLWQDEIGSIDQATRDLPSLFFRFHLSPFYFICLRYWIRLFALTEVALRSLSALFGIASIYLIYRLGKLLLNVRAGIISCLLLSLSPLHIFYSQETRHYSLFVFLTLLSMIIFVELVQKNSTEKKYLYLAYAVTNILLLYTNLWSFFVIFIQNLFFLINPKKAKKKWLIIQAMVIFVFFIWLIPFLVFLLQDKEYLLSCIKWIPRTNLSSLIDLIRTFSYGGPGYGGNDFLVAAERILFSGLLSAIFLFFLLIGLIPQRKEGYGNTLLINLWFFVPVGIAYLVSMLFCSVFVIRYFIFILPAFYLLVAKGIARLKGYYQLAACMLIVIFIIPALLFYYKTDIKIRWDSILSYVEQKREDRGVDLIIVAPSHQAQMFAYKAIMSHKKQESFSIPIVKDLGIKLYKGGFQYKYEQLNIFGINDEKQLQELIRQGRINQASNFLLIITRWEEESRQIQDYLYSRFKLIDIKDFEGATIFYF